MRRSRPKSSVGTDSTLSSNPVCPVFAEMALFSIGGSAIPAKLHNSVRRKRCKVRREPEAGTVGRMHIPTRHL